MHPNFYGALAETLLVADPMPARVQEMLDIFEGNPSLSPEDVALCEQLCERWVRRAAKSPEP